MVNALSSSYQCPSIGFRQMVPPLPTSGSHSAAFRARLVDPFSEKACLLCGIGTSLCATVLHLRSHSASPSSTPVLHYYCWLSLLCPGLLPSLYIIPPARRNVVVAPGRILAISSLVLPMLLLLLLGVVMPRVDAFVRQPSFVLLDIVHDGSKVCATPTGAPGAVAVKVNLSPQSHSTMMCSGYQS